MILATNVYMMPRTCLVFYMAAMSVFLMMILYKLLLNKKIDYITIGVFVVTFIILLLKNNSSSSTFIILWLVLIYIYGILENLRYLFGSYLSNIRKNKLIEQIKSDTSDFYLCLNKKRKVVDFSPSLSVITKLSKKELIGKDGWNILFKNLNILKLNNEEFIISNEKTFLLHIEDDLTKNKMTQFNFDVLLPEENKIVHFIGLVQGHYFKDRLIGTAIYVYRDKMALVDEIKKKLLASNKALLNYKNVLNILMSLSDGVCLYFDYQEKLYYATQAFINYVGLEKQTYTFQELYAMIDEEDKNDYIEQSERINAVSATRIKFHLNVKNTLFNAVEDSIFISASGEEFVSIIHITGVSNDSAYNEILSTKESVDLISSLAENEVSSLVEKTADIIEKALRIDNHEE